MSLLEMQRAVAGILTDEDLRDWFFVEPDAALARYDLSPAEHASLRDLDRKRVAAHAHIVMYAQMDRALEAFPLTRRIVTPHLDELVPRYCRLHPPAPPDPAARASEASRLFDFLLEEQAQKRRWPEWFEDLLRYEECLFRIGTTIDSWESWARALEANAAGSKTLTAEAAGRFGPRLGAHVEVRTFRCDVTALARRLLAAKVPKRVAQKQVKLLVGRERTTLAVSSIRLDELTARLVERCDGELSVAEILTVVTPETAITEDERAAFRGRALAAFRALWDSHAVMFVLRAESAAPQSG